MGQFMKHKVVNEGAQKQTISDDSISQARAAVMASNEISDCKTIFVGIGLPCLVAHITQNYTSPNCHLVFESGLMEVKCKTQPLSLSLIHI